MRARAAESAKQGLLTPSELLLLNAEDVVAAPRADLPDDLECVLPHTEERVSAQELARLLIATAILANEEARAIRLETSERENGQGAGRTGARSGLRLALHLRPGNIMPDWPERSLEDAIDFLVGWAAHNGHNEVWDIVYHLLDRDDRHPGRLVVGLAEDGLGHRGLLQRCGDEDCPFTPTRWVLRGRMARFVARESAHPLRNLIDRTRAERGEVWRLLEDQIGLAFERRQEDVGEEYGG